MKFGDNNSKYFWASACLILLNTGHHGLYHGEGRFSTTHSGKTTGPILIKLEI